MAREQRKFSPQEIELARQVVSSIRSDETPLVKKAALSAFMLFGVGYLLFPVDAIPDALPLIGTIDDLVAMTVAFGPLYRNARRRLK